MRDGAAIAHDSTRRAATLHSAVAHPALRSPTSLLHRSLLETRVVGVLVEKERTVPDSYPLSLNALVLGCNQKTSRAPMMEASEADVQAALDDLSALSLVVESSRRARDALRAQPAARAGRSPSRRRRSSRR